MSGAIWRESPGIRHWIEQWEDAEGMSTRARFSLAEKHNALWIAPHQGNVKIDRVVCYQDDRRDAAHLPGTPVSPFHPWSRP